jgi:hypothetical protein
MAVTLWIDSAAEESVELGPTFPCYAAFAEMARAAGGDWRSRYADLSGVLTQCEDQADADPDWLASVRSQAASFLREFGGRLGEDARGVLRELAAGA